MSSYLPGSLPAAFKAPNQASRKGAADVYTQETPVGAELFPKSSPGNICAAGAAGGRRAGRLLVRDLHRHPIEREITRGVAGNIDDPHAEVGVGEVGRCFGSDP